jgi:NAD(P)-dependent dehydrogenase (short-subunit alcohol dehydrogenase family)
MARYAAPLTKKAPGDRPISFEEIGRFASLIMDRASEGKVTELPPSSLREIVSLLRKRKPPAFLSSIDPSASKSFVGRIARTLESDEVRVRIVDGVESTGFPRESARPVYEVLLVDRGGKLLWEGKKGLLSGGGATATIFLTSAFFEGTRSRPHLLLQAILHPVLEWVLGFPHMVAVLCESAYNAIPPGTEGDDVSDLNRFIAEEAGRERDFTYFDRILGTSYEPDEFRMEELAARFGPEESRTREVVLRANAMGSNFRKLMEEILSSVKEEIAIEGITEAKKALDEGEAERALTFLRKLLADPGFEGRIREEADTLVDVAIRSYALDADPAYEGLSLENGEILAGPLSFRKAREFAKLLEESIAMVRNTLLSMVPQGVEGGSDPLGGNGVRRIIHVLPDLERPSAKFIDGHDRVHWVFSKSFVDALLSGRATGNSPLGIPAIMACRFVRDGVFPDEKLKIDRQFAIAVKGAVEGYRFYQSLPEDVREEMAAFHESSGTADPLYRLFLSLGEETHPAKASHLIRRAVAISHSYNYVRYPETPLAGKVIVITGGGTGMGRSLALEAAIQGANVVVTGRRPRPLEETKADMDDLIRHLGLTNQTLIVQGDVSDPKYVGEMFERIEKEFGRIDILYNNAGVSGPVDFGSVYQDDHFEQYREAVGIHLTGSWLASMEAARVMENQPGGGLIVMIGTFYCESIHRHVMHAYPGRLPYTSAQSAKLALGDYLAWMFAEKKITVVSLNPSAVSTERIQRGSGVFDKGSRARARIGRKVSPESLEKDTLDRTVGREFVQPRDFARVALEMNDIAFRRTEGGQRIPLGGVTYEQPPGVLPSPAVLSRYPDMVGKVALVTVHRPRGNDIPLLETTVRALGRSGANIVLAGGRPGDLERLALQVNATGGEGMATVSPANLGNPLEIQQLFDGLPRIDLLLHFTGSADWKRPLTTLPFEEWTATVDQFGYIPRLLCWQAERRMDQDGVDGTIVLVGPDLSGIPSIRERNLVQVFQAMLRPAVATESMERALMRKAHTEGDSPSQVQSINIGLILPGRTDGRNKQADPSRTAATVLWLLEEGKKVSGVALLPDEQNALARLPAEPEEMPDAMAGKVVVVTGGIRNLGKEISLRLAAEKATVVIASRRPAPALLSGKDADEAKAALGEADATLSVMRSLGARSLWIDADVSRPQKVQAVIEETKNRFGRIDAFVNNAGAGGDFSLVGDVLRDHRPSWDAVLRSNFLGPWTAACLLRDVMRNQKGGGTILNVSTHYADHPYLFRTIYTVSKILLKSLTQALRESLAADNIAMADVAPSLIAGPRMDWVMRNYAVKFAEQFERIPGLSAAEARSLQERFVSSFDRTLPAGKREKAADSFLSAVGTTRLPKGTRADMETWYANVGEWFRSTVPDAPPTNGQVADAVLYGVKNARFLEDRFLGVTALPPFSSFPPAHAAKKLPISGETFLVLSVGSAGKDESVPASLAASLVREGARVTSLRDSAGGKGRVDITLPSRGNGRSGVKRSHDTLSRELDISDPRILEPWLDNALLGGPRPAGAVLFLGTTAADRAFLLFSPDERENFLLHLTKSLSVLAECARAVRDEGHVIVVMPPDSTEEGRVIRAAARQIVRTALAEQHFLFLGRPVRFSLVSPSAVRGGQDVVRRVREILAGQAPPEIEPAPVGRPRP